MGFFLNMFICVRNIPISFAFLYIFIRKKSLFVLLSILLKYAYNFVLMIKNVKNYTLNKHPYNYSRYDKIKIFSIYHDYVDLFYIAYLPRLSF